MNWLKLRDQNTAFFHRYASPRHHANQVRELKDESGLLVIDVVKMAEIYTNYFSKLCTSQGIGRMDAILDRVQKCITLTMNQALMAPYLKDELLAALKCMGPAKAVGDNGFSAIFYQQFWYIIGEDVRHYYLQILNNDVFGAL